MESRIVPTPISDEVAILAKKNGFSNGSPKSLVLYKVDNKNPEGDYYFKKGDREVNSQYFINGNKDVDYSGDAYDMYELPYQCVLLEWFRINNIHILVDTNASGWFFELYNVDSGSHIYYYDLDSDTESGYFNSYDDATNAGLLKAFEYLK
jgi:hypothetical protein